MNPQNIQLPDLGLFPNLEKTDFTKLPPLPSPLPNKTLTVIPEKLELKRQNAYCTVKPKRSRYYRYHELINTINEFKKENKRLRGELERYSKKYLL